MDGFTDLQPPQAYEEIQWLADTLVFFMGVGWLINYAGMIWHSYKGETYSMAIIPLCNNIGWELVYTLVYPSSNRVEVAVFAAGVTLNVIIMVAATRAAKTEWSHSPLVARHTPLIFLAGTLMCFAGHLALAAEIGPALAYSWGAVICQIVLSLGGLCQLLQRNSTRGTSWTLWLSRFLGSSCTVGFASLRWKFWPEAFGWLGSPLVLWSLAAFLLIDATYGVCLYFVSRAESLARKPLKSQ
ncbi:terpene cyclase atmB [Hirsutella rhossiliensis]|uniref:Terpene cyclase atmB n=1 Tax=Hirsutella rhossiliensis TaxID=111463 RepID=A0A9P8MVF8_9HYPO|nr:terpene cyclase atmB [Hirsutella rhossiliensis]KAH0960971.1 terpene cyclase atmB [Hirsutella rhossiliensis]